MPNQDELNNNDAQKLMDQIIRQQLVAHSFGIPEEFVKPITYVATQNGNYEVRKTPFGHMVIEVKRLPEIEDAGMITGLHFTGPKIPFQFARRWTAGSRLVSRTYETEFLYYLFYDASDPENPWREYIPRQVTRGGNTVEQDVNERPNLYMAMHLHSHPGFSCNGFSPGDFRNDSDSGSAMLFGLQEQIWNEQPLFHFRAKCGHEFINLNFYDIFTNPLFDNKWEGETEIPAEEWLAKVTPDTRTVIDLWDHQRGMESVRESAIPVISGENHGCRMHAGVIIRLCNDHRCKKETKLQRLKDYIQENDLTSSQMLQILQVLENDSTLHSKFAMEYFQEIFEQIILSRSKEQYQTVIQETAQRAAGFGCFSDEENPCMEEHI